MVTYKMRSNDWISAPGMVAWAKHFYKSPSDRANVLNVIMAGWNIPEEAAHALLSGKIKFAVEGEVVIFDA